MSKTKNVLIVEDDLLHVFFLKRAIAHLGHNVIGSTGDGSKAIELAIEHVPEIILMDITLAGKFNGVETAERIAQHIDCFIIFITGISNADILKQTHKLTSSTILSKPITATMIQKAIKNYSKPRP
ncbi:MAG: response regulator [Candidatus Paceibacterota bacterium]